MSYKINLDDTLCKAEAIYLQIKDSKYQSDIVQSILGIEATTPPVRPARKSKPLIKPVKPPGFAVPVNKDEASGLTSSSSDNLDEFVDLEPHCQLPFDLFS